MSRQNKIVLIGEPIAMHHNALCTQTINPILPAKTIYPRKMRKLEEHAGKFLRPVTEWE